MEENLLGDTRVFLYHEVLSTMNNRINWLIGGGSSAYYDSVWFYDDGGTMKGKRYGTEVGILNILLRYGIIGVLLYGLLLFNVSRIAITQSNNRLAKMIGLLIAFRWLLSFIEEYTQYDLNFYFFWLIMGLVSTSFFRKMNDKQIRKYLQAI